MSSPIFDATFGTGRFRYEEPMTTDPTTSPSPEPQDVREALELPGLIEAADLSDVGLFPYQDEHKVVVYFNTSEAASRYGEYLKELLRSRPAGRSDLIPDCPTDGVAARQGNGG